MSKVQGECDHELYLTDYNRESDNVTEYVHFRCTAECTKCGAIWSSDYSWDIKEGEQCEEGEYMVTQCDNPSCGHIDNYNYMDFFKYNDEDFCDKDCALEVYGVFVLQWFAEVEEE